MSCFNSSRHHSATGRHESSGVRTEEGGDQKDDQWSGQGWHGENLLHRFPCRYDTENGNYKVFICAHCHFCSLIKMFGFSEWKKKSDLRSHRRVFTCYMCTFSFPFSSPLLSFQYVYLSNPLIIRLCTLQLPCLLLYFRLRRTQKKKSWRRSACSMTTKQARSPSGTWSGWPKSWGRTSQTKSCRYASTKPHASFSSPHPCIVLTSFPPLCLWRRW